MFLRTKLENLIEGIDYELNSKTRTYRDAIQSAAAEAGKAAEMAATMENPAERSKLGGDWVEHYRQQADAAAREADTLVGNRRLLQGLLDMLNAATPDEEAIQAFPDAALTIAKALRAAAEKSMHIQPLKKNAQEIAETAAVIRAYRYSLNAMGFNPEQIDELSKNAR